MLKKIDQIETIFLKLENYYWTEQSENIHHGLFFCVWPIYDIKKDIRWTEQKIFRRFLIYRLRRPTVWHASFFEIIWMTSDSDRTKVNKGMASTEPSARIIFIRIRVESRDSRDFPTFCRENFRGLLSGVIRDSGVGICSPLAPIDSDPVKPSLISATRTKS